MRRVIVEAFFCYLFILCSPVISQEMPAAAQEVQHHEEEPLKAFQPPNRAQAVEASVFVSVLLFGTIAVVLIMFILLAFFHEPSQASQPSISTKVVRAEGFQPYRREREQKSERINLDDELSS